MPYWIIYRPPSPSLPYEIDYVWHQEQIFRCSLREARNLWLLWCFQTHWNLLSWGIHVAQRLTAKQLKQWPGEFSSFKKNGTCKWHIQYVLISIRTAFSDLPRQAEWSCTYNKLLPAVEWHYQESEAVTTVSITFLWWADMQVEFCCSYRGHVH